MSTADRAERKSRQEVGDEECIGNFSGGCGGTFSGRVLERERRQHRDDDDDDERRQGAQGRLYIDNVRFLDSSGDVLGTFDSFENFSGSNILCGGSSVDVWQDLKAADSAWGGQGATPASSTLHVTERLV